MESSQIDSESDRIMPVWGTVLLWIAIPASLLAVMFGIPWIIGWALNAMLGNVFFNF